MNNIMNYDGFTFCALRELFTMCSMSVVLYSISCLLRVIGRFFMNTSIIDSSESRDILLLCCGADLNIG